MRYHRSHGHPEPPDECLQICVEPANNVFERVLTMCASTEAVVGRSTTIGQFDPAGPIPPWD